MAGSGFIPGSVSFFGGRTRPPKLFFLILFLIPFRDQKEKRKRKEKKIKMLSSMATALSSTQYLGATRPSNS